MLVLIETNVSFELTLLLEGYTYNLTLFDSFAGKVDFFEQLQHGFLRGRILQLAANVFPFGYINIELASDI